LAKGAANRQPYNVENDLVSFRLIPRTPDQMAAFYIGRGFPANAVAAIKSTCFITVIVRNTSKQITWLDLSQWEFRQDNDPVRRLNRDY